MVITKVIYKCDASPQLEVGVHHPVGETFTANTDAFKHTVTCQLVHHKVRVDETCPINLQVLQMYDLPFFTSYNQFELLTNLSL